MIMLYEYLKSETYVSISSHILSEVKSLYPNPNDLSDEIESCSSYLDKRQKIVAWLAFVSLYSYSEVWKLREWMPSSFSSFTDYFVYRIYFQIATEVIYSYVYEFIDA